MTLTRLMPTPPSTSAQRNASRPLRVRTSDSHTALSCRMFQPCTPSRPFPTVDAGFPSGYLRKCRVFPCFTTSSGASSPPMKKKTHHASFFFFLTARKARGNDFFKSGQNADAAILYLEAARYLPARVTEELPDSKDLLGSLHSNTAAAQATLFLFCFFILFFFWGGGRWGGVLFAKFEYARRTGTAFHAILFCLYIYGGGSHLSMVPAAQAHGSVDLCDSCMHSFVFSPEHTAACVFHRRGWGSGANRKNRRPRRCSSTRGI